RHLDRVVDRSQLVLQLRLEDLAQRERDVGFLAEVLGVGGDFVIGGEQRRGLREILARQHVQLQAVARDVSELVRRKAGVDDVRHQHRVGPSLGCGPPCRMQTPQLALRIMRDEEAAGLEELAKRGGGVRVVEGDEERLAALHRERRAEIRLDPDCDRLRVACESADILTAFRDAKLAFDRRRLGQILLHERRELQAREDVVQLRAIRLAEAESVEIELVLEVALDARELARKIRLLSVLLELLALRRFQLVEILVDAVERTVFGDQRLRTFLADARNARDVVDRVAPDGHDIDDLLWRKSERFFHSLRVVEQFAACVVEADAISDELKKVFVRCGDDHVVTAIARGAGDRADQVVRFPILDADGRNAEALEHFVDEGKLNGKIVGHRPAILLVILERFMPRLGRTDVERNCDVIGLMVLEELAQRGGEPVHGVRRHSGGVRQIADREVGAIDVVGAVDEEQLRAFGRHGWGLYGTNGTYRTYGTYARNA